MLHIGSNLAESNAQLCYLHGKQELSAATVRAICKLYMQDFVCLSFQVPDVCRDLPGAVEARDISETVLA